MNRRCTLDIITAAELIETSLNSGRNGFFVNTEFGTIGVEVNDRIMYDPMVPVEVVPWVHAPSTSWTVKQKDRQADFYMSVDQPESKPSTHLHVVEGITRCMIQKILGFDPDSRIIDTAVYLYEKHNCNKVWTVNALEKEFIKINLGILVRNDRVVKMLVRDMITRRIIDTDEIISKLENLLSSYDDIGENVDEYTRSIFGLMVYTVKRFPERIGEVNKSFLEMMQGKSAQAQVISFNKIAIGGI